MKETIASRYARLDSDRAQSLETARLCSKYTDATILPEKFRNPDDKLPTTYQSLGGRRLSAMSGRMMLQVFPPGTPWFLLIPSGSAKSQAMSGEDLNDLTNELFLQSVMVQTLLEQGGLNREDRNPIGFRTSMRQAVAQIIATGDWLGRIDDDYQIVGFRRDQYVTRRDQKGRVLEHIVREMVDPADLTDEQIAKSELKPEAIELASDRDGVELHTQIRWSGDSWRITQEINSNVVNESNEKVTPYLSVYNSLPTGSHYGVGYIELNALGDLRSFSAIRQSLLDLAYWSSKIHPVIDPSSSIRDEDLEEESGRPFHDAVEGNRPRNIAFLQVDKTADFTVVKAVHDDIERHLSQSTMNQSGQVRQSERTTAYEVSETVIKENEEQVGGVQAVVSDQLQIPLVRRCLHMIGRDRLRPPIPMNLVDMRAIAGLEALARVRQSRDLLDVIQVAQVLGPDVIGKLNLEVVFDVLLRYRNIHEPGIIKSKQEQESEKQDAMSKAIQAQAAQTAIETAGQVVVNQNKPQ